MSDVENILSSRQFGETVPVSVGTGEAMAAIGKAGKMEVLWINMATLVRNLFESIQTEQRNLLLQNRSHYPEIANAFKLEIDRERQVIAEVAASHGLEVRYYLLGYKDLGHRFPFARLRTPKTELQLQRMEIITQTIERIMGADVDQHIEYDKGSQIRGEPKRALIITHYPTDLLSRMKFTQLRLLESHTGAVKSKSQWGTKLTEGSKLGRMPFNYFTIQIFGDNNAHFDRYPVEIRRAIIELANLRHWTELTKIDKIRYSIEQMKDRYAAVQLLKML